MPLSPDAGCVAVKNPCAVASHLSRRVKLLLGKHSMTGPDPDVRLVHASAKTRTVTAGS